MRGFDGRGALQRWPEGLGAWGHARRPSELAPIGGGCCRADCHSHAAEPPHRVSPRPSTRRHDQPPSQTAGGSASPQGEARRECAGKAKRSACRAREDYGWGWAGRCKQAVPGIPPKTRPPNTRGSASRSPIARLIRSAGEEELSGFGGRECVPPSGDVLEPVHREL